MSNVRANHHGIRIELAVGDGVGDSADLGLDLHRHYRQQNSRLDLQFPI